MPAARCSLCNANFGDAWVGKLCPICEIEELAGFQDVEPDDEAELNSLVAHARFDRYLEETGRA